MKLLSRLMSVVLVVAVSANAWGNIECKVLFSGVWPFKVHPGQVYTEHESELSAILLSERKPVLILADLIRWLDAHKELTESDLIEFERLVDTIKSSGNSENPFIIVMRSFGFVNKKAQLVERIHERIEALHSENP